MSRVNGANLRSFAPWAHTSSLQWWRVAIASCERFDRLGIWNPYFPIQGQRSYRMCYLVGDFI